MIEVASWFSVQEIRCSICCESLINRDYVICNLMYCSLNATAISYLASTVAS